MREWILVEADTYNEIKYKIKNRLESGAAMKLYQHVLIIAVLIFLTYYLYGNGLGAIAFSLTTIYLAFILYKQLKEWKKLKNEE
ncbi:hypothetical protein [Sporosarcina sp. FA9]|uniref:hypothetical protein n=1 Tax=Sporosarcina sp. FA9 TaxID=3413030 RepID=UPI003F658E45